MTDNERCVWCTAPNGKTDLTFAIIDDDLGQYVPHKRIKYCPFCGRELQKMTDNEIIKALECKGNDKMDCLSCPYSPRYPDCDRYAVRDALSLINRQKAEIERLHSFETYIHCRAEAIKEFEERVKRYIDVGHLRPPTEKCFSELDVVSMIDNLVKEMVGEGG